MHLYDDRRRETNALLAAATLGLGLDRIWEKLALGYPGWLGINVPYSVLLGTGAHFEGDVDLLAIPPFGTAPDFGKMCAVEVKVIRFSLDDELKVMDKIAHAERQAMKLAHIGIPKVAVLYILITENRPHRDRGGSLGFDDATDRALAAFDEIRRRVRGQNFLFPTFVWPWGAHPTRPEYEAGTGCPLHLGGPLSWGQDSDVLFPKIRRAIPNCLGQFLSALPRPVPLWYRTNVFGQCHKCRGAKSHFHDMSFCGCGAEPTIQ